jgi:antitoxin component YwqK of YwqJK toxin-antitoxin module
VRYTRRVGGTHGFTARSTAFRAAALPAVIAMSLLDCQHEPALKGAFGKGSARMVCSAGRRVITEGSSAWCARPDGVRDGAAVTFADETRTTVIAMGQYENGKQSGRWVSRRPNGTLFDEVHYRNGLRHGPWRADHANGKPEVRGEYWNGEQHGHWTWWHDNGVKKAESQYARGKEVGRSREWDEEGAVVSDIGYDADEPHGHYLVVSTLSMIQVEGNYVHGKREGLWVWTHLSTKCRAFGYHGPQDECAKPSTKAQEGTYRRDQREGLWKSFHSNSVLESQGVYRHDKKEGVWRYFSLDGKPSREIGCRAGQATGAYREWNESGQLQLRGGFRDGQPIGAWSIRYPGEDPRTLLCKLDEHCEHPGGGLWSDITAACDTTEQPEG